MEKGKPDEAAGAAPPPAAAAAQDSGGEPASPQARAPSQEPEARAGDRGGPPADGPGPPADVGGARPGRGASESCCTSAGTAELTRDSAGPASSSQGGPHKLPRPEGQYPCPRCSSSDTKFAYYNNYNVNQPRFYCRGCQRYWTAGGNLRSVPVGAGKRKHKPPAPKPSSKPAPKREAAAASVPVSAEAGTASPSVDTVAPSGGPARQRPGPPAQRLAAVPVPAVGPLPIPLMPGMLAGMLPGMLGPMPMPAVPAVPALAGDPKRPKLEDAGAVASAFRPYMGPAASEGGAAGPAAGSGPASVAAQQAWLAWLAMGQQHLSAMQSQIAQAYGAAGVPAPWPYVQYAGLPGAGAPPHAMPFVAPGGPGPGWPPAAAPLDGQLPPAPALPAASPQMMHPAPAGAPWLPHGALGAALLGMRPPQALSHMVPTPALGPELPPTLPVVAIAAGTGSGPAPKL